MLKAAQKELTKLEAKKAEAEEVLKKLLASGMSADEILEKLKQGICRVLSLRGRSHGFCISVML